MHFFKGKCQPVFNLRSFGIVRQGRNQRICPEIFKSISLTVPDIMSNQGPPVPPKSGAKSVHLSLETGHINVVQSWSLGVIPDPPALGAL